VDINKLIARAKNILLTPKTEWPAAAAEPDTVAGLYQNYIIVLAAIPAVFGFIKGSLIGYGAFGITVRTPIAAGIGAMIVHYVLTLALVFVMALIIDALAASFGGQKNQVQALKTVAYAYTASWVASVALIVPFLGFLVVLAAAIYGIYLLYLGLPYTMKCPQDKAAGYTAVSIIIAIVLSWIVGIVVVGITGAGSLMSVGASHLGSTGSSVTVDPNSALGKLAAMGERASEAGKKMDAAQKAGDANAQAQAAGQMLGAMLGGGDQVEALAPDALKPFVPDTLGGLPRSSYEAARNGQMGIQVSNARATYRNPQGGPELQLEITDTGGAKGFMALAGFAGIEEDKQTDHGYEKTYHQDGRMVHEQWNTNGNNGEFTIVLGDRFVVAVHGSGVGSVDALKQAVASLNLGGLEALKNAGVKKG
jgi:hypothetical protein